MPIESRLPGEDLVREGLDDLCAHKQTLNALLVAVGAPRLRRLGLILPPDDELPARPEHQLYDLLAAQNPTNAHSTYNALIRRLVSYEHALELAIAQTATPSSA